MNKNSLKSLVLGFVALFSAASVNAGSGTQASPFLVCGESNFKLVSTVTAPSGGSYQWFNEDGSAISSATSASLTVNASSPSAVTDKVYKVVVYNAALCPSDSGKIYVTVVPKPTNTATVDNAAFCSAQASGSSIALGGTIATNPSLPSGVTYTYAWTTANGGTITNASTLAATTVPPTTAGTYTYTLAVNYAGLDAYPTSGGGCLVSDGVDISVSETPATPGATIEAL